MKFIDSSFTGSITTSPRWDRNGKPKTFSASISEIMGTFFFVQMYMICTDPKTQFSKDRVVNCFIISSGYISSRLLAGGELVSVSGTQPLEFKATGPLLNPALAFGQMLMSLNFDYFWQYFLCPIIGAVFSIYFYD